MGHDDIRRHALSRRQLLGWAAAGLTAGLLPRAGHAALSGKKVVVVVGAGMAGMTAAKYLRLWGGSGLQVTLVEPETLYTSNIMSNLVLNGSRSVSSLRYARDTLVTKYGVQRITGSVATLNPGARAVTLADGTTLPYDRLVLAPGVSFDEAYGLTQADYDTRTPHAWRAGAQTTLLRNQLVAMRNGDTFVMSIPKAPYRCPPGPYERACVVADYLKKAKGSNCRVLVLDENTTIQAERHTFEQAFGQTHAGVIRYEAGISGLHIDAASRQLSYLDAVLAPHTVQAQAINPIPPHRAQGSAPGGMAGAGRAEQQRRRPLGGGGRAELREHGAAWQRHPRHRRCLQLRPAEGRPRGQPRGKDLRRRHRAPAAERPARPAAGGQLGLLFADHRKHSLLADGDLPVRPGRTQDEAGHRRRQDGRQRRAGHGHRVGHHRQRQLQEHGHLVPHADERHAGLMRRPV